MDVAYAAQHSSCLHSSTTFPRGVEEVEGVARQPLECWWKRVGRAIDAIFCRHYQWLSPNALCRDP